MTDMTLKGAIALVTGASRGIGRAMALELAKAGAHVVATARTQGGLEELDDEIRKAGGSSSLVPLDLKDPEGIEKLADIVRQRWGKLDILLHAAGELGRLTPAAQVSPQAWSDVMSVNLIAGARLIRAFEGLLMEADAPRAVFISSSSAESRRPYWGPYAASKAALDALVQSWAREHKESALRANLVYPPAMRTAMRYKAYPGEDQDTLPTPDALWPTISPLLSPDCETTAEIVRYQRLESAST